MSQWLPLRRGLALAAVLALVAGCGPSRTTPGPAAATTPPEVRADRGPIGSRFPALGEFINVTWVSWSVTDPRVPGPNTYEIQALVVLRSQDLQAAEAAYTWNKPPAPFDIQARDELRAFLPPNADWHISDDYTFALALTNGDRAYLDLTSGTVFLDAIEGS
jgi:hypothetical protein